MENIIFGILAVIAIGAGIFTCIYEAGGSSHTNTDEQSTAEQSKK